MADNTNLNVGSGGDVIRDLDRSGVKTQIVALDLRGGVGEEQLASQQLPVNSRYENDILTDILTELRVISFYLKEGMNVQNDIGDVRNTMCNELNV